MKILFCEPGYSLSRERLAPLIPGWQIVVCNKTDIASRLDGIDVVVPYGAIISRDIINAGSFGLVQQFGVGLETVDIVAATAAGVWVANVPSAGSGNAESVAEHAVFLMLALSRRWREAERAFQRREVGEPAGIALRGKTACIVGLGHVGSALAKLLLAFGMNVKGVRTHAARQPADWLAAIQIHAASDLPAALADADYVIACARLTDETRHIFNDQTFATMKPGTFFVNVARGGLVDPEALLTALKTDRLAGAGLDVFWQEPVDPAHPIFRHNVVYTPHVAGVTDDSYDGIARAVAQNLYRFARGEPPHYAANSPPIPRWSPATAVR